MPEVSTVTLEQIYADIVESVGYKTTVGPIDKSKVARRYAGEKTELPSARLARAAWRVAAALKPLVPPVTVKKVAPRVANNQGGSDARFCMFNTDGSLRPGVSRLANGEYTDESGAKYAPDGDGLERSSVRSKEWVDGVVGAKEIDGRPICSLPMAGSAALGTGSWKV